MRIVWETGGQSSRRPDGYTAACLPHENWLGFSSTAEADRVFYLDNLRIQRLKQ